MKRKKQINESKELIFNALMNLLKTKTLEEITMSEIAGEAGVVRMTLYRHFKEKDDIILFGFEQNLETILEEIKKKENPSILDLLIFRFKSLQESPYTKILAKHHRLDKLFQTVGSKNIHHFTSLVPQLNEPYIQAFLGGGVDSLTTLWIKNGMKEHYEDMAHMVLDILNRFK